MYIEIVLCVCVFLSGEQKIVGGGEDRQSNYVFNMLRFDERRAGKMVDPNEAKRRACKYRLSFFLLLYNGVKNNRGEKVLLKEIK